jgi:hypothetical protein
MGAVGVLSFFMMMRSFFSSFFSFLDLYCLQSKLKGSLIPHAVVDKASNGNRGIGASLLAAEFGVVSVDSPNRSENPTFSPLSWPWNPSGPESGDP